MTTRTWALLGALLLVGTACGSTANRQATDAAAERDGLGGSTPTIDVPGGDADGELGAGVSSGGRAAGGRTGGRTGAAVAGSGGTVPRVGAGGATGPIKIGVEYQEIVQGCTEIAVVCPDTREFADAVIADLNKRGGIRGRRVQHVYFGYGDGTNFVGEEQASCTLFTEDHDVVAVVGKSFGHTDSFLSCLGQAGVPYIESGVMQHDAEDLRRFPLYFNPANIRLDRAGVLMVDGLAAQGFFVKGARVGLLTFDGAAYDRANEALAAALARHGVQLVETAKIGHDISVQATEAQQAVLRLKLARADRVLVRYVNFQFFAHAAEGQGYRPAYGLASDIFPDDTQQTSPPDQFHGAKGVGWWPATDVRDPGDPAQLGRTARCLKIVREAGVPTPEGNALRIAQITCETIWLVEEAAARSAGLDGEQLRVGIEALGNSFVPASTFASRLGPGRHDGAGGLRYFAFDEGCSCFRYTTGVLDAG
jgi:ABC-type branched-subunit amino acid transport system substrate-binding protein